jgi:hypothetical protein
MNMSLSNIQMVSSQVIFLKLSCFKLKHRQFALVCQREIWYFSGVLNMIPVVDFDLEVERDGIRCEQG